MNSKTTLPISEARKKIFQIIDKAQQPGVFYTLTSNGKPKAVIMSASEFESWQETLETLEDMPDLKKDIKETEEAIRSGEYKNWISLEEILAKEGFLVAEKTFKKDKYALQNKTKRKGQKRAC